jgi:hypothetical protein
MLDGPAITPFDQDSRIRLLVSRRLLHHGMFPGTTSPVWFGSTNSGCTQFVWHGGARILEHAAGPLPGCPPGRNDRDAEPPDGILIQQAALRPTVSEIVRTLKSLSARKINQERGGVGVSVWQRGFFERVIRDEREFANVREYIRTNPLRWPSRRTPNHRAGRGPAPAGPLTARFG